MLFKPKGKSKKLDKWSRVKQIQLLNKFMYLYRSDECFCGFSSLEYRIYQKIVYNFFLNSNRIVFYMKNDKISTILHKNDQIFLRNIRKKSKITLSTKKLLWSLWQKAEKDIIISSHLLFGYQLFVLKCTVAAKLMMHLMSY